MLALRYASGWRIGGVVLLSLILAFALLPLHWFLAPKSTPQFAHLDKWIHGVTFAVLALWYSGQYARHAYWRVTTALLAFGLSIELLQRFLAYRSADWMDLAADAAGVIVGMAIALTGFGGWSLRIENWLHGQHG